MSNTKTNLLFILSTTLLQPVFAETNTHSQFDIKSVKPGMTLEQADSSLIEKCKGEMYRRLKKGMVVDSCATGSDEKDYAEFIAKDKVFSVVDGQLVKLKSTSTKQTLIRTLANKSIELYGKPDVSFSGEVSLAFTSGESFNQRRIQYRSATDPNLDFISSGV